MPQNFMYKRVNIFLLILMCLIVMGLAGSAIYFQESFKGLSSNYDSVLSNFTACQEDRDDKLDRLNSCIEDLNSTAIDITKYDVLYEEKVDQLQKAQQELRLMDQELKETKLDLSQAESQYEEQVQKVNELNQQIIDLNQEIDSLESSLDNCQDNLNACQGGS